MKHLSFLLLLLGAAMNGHAEVLGQVITLTPPSGWEQVKPFSAVLAESPFPTLKYLPRDGQHAEIVITLLPADVLGYEVTDPASLRKFSLVAAQPFLTAGTSPPAPLEFALPEGLAVTITATCPPSPGATGDEKPRLATVAGLLIGSKHLVHVTIIHDEGKALELMQALHTMLSMRHVSSAPATLAQVR